MAKKRILFAGRIFVYLFFFSCLDPMPPCFGQDAPAAKQIKIARYLFSIDAAASGYPISGVRALFIDTVHEELYVLDDSNQRVVITTLNGTFLYQFKYSDAGVLSMPAGIAAAEDGLLYIAEERRVVITTYRGEYKKVVDLSSIPDRDSMIIQSIAMEGDALYLGDGVNGRIIVMDRKKETFVRQFREGLGHNIFMALDNEGIYVKDSPMFSVIHLDKNGNALGRWGAMSSLAGGFSMLADITVDRKNGRVIVLDINRLEVIFFDRNGNFTFEFGGPNTFHSPSSVAVDNKDRVYIFDSRKIRVFQMMTD